MVKSIDPNQIYLDRAGTCKMGCFDEAILVPCKGKLGVVLEKNDPASGKD